MLTVLPSSFKTGRFVSSLLGAGLCSLSARSSTPKKSSNSAMISSRPVLACSHAFRVTNTSFRNPPSPAKQRLSLFGPEPPPSPPSTHMVTHFFPKIMFPIPDISNASANISGANAFICFPSPSVQATVPLF